tara:strand:+ start:384 stop:683 length:300 start_codon:yes stop_codon:yes gene_type:complete
MQKFKYEYTDTIGGFANRSWVKRGTVYTHDLVHYGYTGGPDGSYTKASKTQTREIMRQVKAELGLTGVKGVRETWGDVEVFRPYGMATVLFVEYDEGES